MLEIDLNWWDYLSLFLIFFVGIPHGALDGAISITLGYSKKISLQIRFLIGHMVKTKSKHVNSRIKANNV